MVASYISALEKLVISTICPIGSKSNASQITGRVNSAQCFKYVLLLSFRHQ